MEENKYYQPSIEEFHVGFYYEIKLKIQNTNNHYYLANRVTTIDTLPDITMFLNDSLRVKYLDKSDIENLGWVLNDRETYYTLGEYVLYFDDKEDTNNEIGITIYWDINNNMVFSGYVKNKSELSKLMKQLGIK